MNLSVCVYDESALQYANALQKNFPQLDVSACTTIEEALVNVATADILVAMGVRVDDELLRAAKALKWIHALTSGTETIENSPFLQPSTWVTSSSGAHRVPMSEHALLIMLALLRDFPRTLENQRSRHWSRWPPPLLSGKTICVVGVGASGTDIAEYCKTFGMRVVGVSDSDRGSLEHFDQLYPRSKLQDAVADAHFVLVLVPHSPQTHHLISSHVFNAMRRDAFFINMARGAVVDELALEQALREHRIAGAGLDVFETEPLPQSSPLWDMPGVIVTPHIGGYADNYVELVLPRLLMNFRSYLCGESLAGVVKRPTE